MDFKEIFTASMILFAIIDIIGATPIVISLREKVGKKGRQEFVRFCNPIKIEKKVEKIQLEQYFV